MLRQLLINISSHFHDRRLLTLNLEVTDAHVELCSVGVGITVVVNYCLELLYLLVAHLCWHRLRCCIHHSCFLIIQFIQ